MSKYDKLFKKAELFEKLAVYGDRSSFLRSISQVTPTVGGTPEAEAYINQFPAPKSEPEKPKYPSIPRDVQEMLARIVTVEGLGLPLAIDGEIGPKTKAALDAFRAKFNVAGNFSDQDTFQVIRNTYNRDPGRYGSIGKGPAPKAPAQAKPPAQQTYPNLPSPEQALKDQQERMKRESTPPGIKG